MSTYLLTGCSRSLGLATVTHLLTFPRTTVRLIFATVRSPSSATELSALAAKDSRVKIVTLADVCDQESVRGCRGEVERILLEQEEGMRNGVNGDGEGKGRLGLDVLVNNAGVIDRVEKDVETLDPKLMLSVYATNVTAVHLVTQTFLPLLRKGRDKKIVNMSSTLGSITWSPQHIFNCPGYKVAKAGLNALTVEWAHTLKKEGFIIFALSPGWLQTPLGGPHAEFPVEHGAKAVAKLVMEADQSWNGKFVADDGSNPPW